MASGKAPYPGKWMRTTMQAITRYKESSYVKFQQEIFLVSKFSKSSFLILEFELKTDSKLVKLSNFSSIVLDSEYLSTVTSQPPKKDLIFS